MSRVNHLGGALARLASDLVVSRVGGRLATEHATPGLSDTPTSCFAEAGFTRRLSRRASANLSTGVTSGGPSRSASERRPHREGRQRVGHQRAGGARDDAAAPPDDRPDCELCDDTGVITSECDHIYWSPPMDCDECENTGFIETQCPSCR